MKHAIWDISVLCLNLISESSKPNNDDDVLAFHCDWEDIAGGMDLPPVSCSGDIIRARKTLFLVKMEVCVDFSCPFCSCWSYPVRCLPAFSPWYIHPSLSFPQSIVRHPIIYITPSLPTCLPLTSPRRGFPTLTGRRRRKRKSQRRPLSLPPMSPPQSKRWRKRKRRMRRKQNLKERKA